MGSFEGVDWWVRRCRLQQLYRAAKRRGLFPCVGIQFAYLRDERGILLPVLGLEPPAAPRAEPVIKHRIAVDPCADGDVRHADAALRPACDFFPMLVVPPVH